MFRQAIALTAVGLLAASAQAATFQNGYTIGSGLLGNDLIFDGATHAGNGTFDIRANDTGSGAGAYNWVAVWPEMWDIGTDVSITGIALPLRSPNTGTANNTSNGTFTFTFYELSGGGDPNVWDGTDNGETVLATADVEFTLAGSGGAIIPYATFDAPINFTSTSNGLAIGVDSTGSIRTRFDTTPEPVEGLHFVTTTGAQQASGAGHQWTLAGTPFFDAPPPPVLPYRFDAALDNPSTRRWESAEPAIEQFAFNIPQPGDYNGNGFTDAADYTVWRDNLGGDASLAFPEGSRDPGAAGVIDQADRTYWADNFGSPTTVPVNDPAVPGITAAYDRGARGQANVYETSVNGLQASRQDGSFEVWFKPDDLAGGDQVIFEIGGTGTGSYLSLSGDQLSFFINGQFDGNEQTVTTTLSDADWTQVAVVINNTFEATLPSSDDFVDIYVDGVLAASSSASPTDINRWAGGNDAGLGQVGGNVAANGPLADATGATPYTFEGEIAIFEYAPGTAWDAAEVLARYNAITSPAASAVPEPSALGLLLTACLAVRGRRG